MNIYLSILFLIVGNILKIVRTIALNILYIYICIYMVSYFNQCTWISSNSCEISKPVVTRLYDIEGDIFFFKFDFGCRRQDKMKVNFILLNGNIVFDTPTFVVLLITSSTRYDPKSLKVKWSNASLQILPSSDSGGVSSRWILCDTSFIFLVILFPCFLNSTLASFIGIYLRLFWFLQWQITHQMK